MKHTGDIALIIGIIILTIIIAPILIGIATALLLRLTGITYFAVIIGITIAIWGGLYGLYRY